MSERPPGPGGEVEKEPLLEAEAGKVDLNSAPMDPDGSQKILYRTRILDLGGEVCPIRHLTIGPRRDKSGAEVSH